MSMSMRVCVMCFLRFLCESGAIVRSGNPVSLYLHCHHMVRLIYSLAYVHVSVRDLAVY